MVSLIWAQGAGRVIGNAGALPWRLPEDLARFRSLTIGNTVLMGRATWESLPAKARPLADRQNLVLTRQPGWSAPGAHRVSTVAEAIKVAAGPVWVIGGSQVYEAAMGFGQRIVMTEVEGSFDGDVYAPELDDSWRIVDREPDVGWSTSATGLRYRVISYERQSPSRDTLAS
jgi:dihydrofolate reductase